MCEHLILHGSSPSNDPLPTGSRCRPGVRPLLPRGPGRRAWRPEHRPRLRRRPVGPQPVHGHGVRRRDNLRIVSQHGPLTRPGLRLYPPGGAGPAARPRDGLVHRDIKPGNLMLDRDRDGQAARPGPGPAHDEPVATRVTDKSQQCWAPPTSWPRSRRRTRGRRHPRGHLRPGLHALLPAHRPGAVPGPVGDGEDVAHQTGRRPPSATAPRYRRAGRVLER